MWKGCKNGLKQHVCSDICLFLQHDPIQRSPVAASTPITKVEPLVIPAARNEPIGLKASDFLPVSYFPIKKGLGKEIGNGESFLSVLLGYLRDGRVF